MADPATPSSTSTSTSSPQMAASANTLVGELNSAAARKILSVVDAVRELYTDPDAMNALQRIAASSDPSSFNSTSSNLNLNMMMMNRGSSSAAAAAAGGSSVPRRRPKRNPNPCGYCSFYKQKVRISLWPTEKVCIYALYLLLTCFAFLAL